MNESKFYIMATESIRAEWARLNAFCKELDGDPAKKKREIAAYKCAKYRDAGISNIWAMFHNCYRLKNTLKDTCYCMKPVYEMLLENESAMEAYRNANEEDKPDLGLYLGIKAFIAALMAEKQKKWETANDWERVELTTYLEGHAFALACIENA
ncbi:MAG: hypothetical protein E7616_04075 [Ruminococcaceae bacterium]|nr:hypothetical protein [Oscillospiraceae bacterium]